MRRHQRIGCLWALMKERHLNQRTWQYGTGTGSQRIRPVTRKNFGIRPVCVFQLCQYWFSKHLNGDRERMLSVFKSQ